MGFLRKHKRLSAAMLVLVVLLAALFVGVAVRCAANMSDIPAMVSKETTYITEPLRADGYPDYVAALNERAGRGVTPDNNAAVLLWQAMGPSGINPEAREKFFQTLGTPQPPEKGEYFVELRNFPAWQASESKKAKSLKKKNPSAKDDLSVALERPWSKQEFPVLAAWLETNERPLTLVVQASKRSRRYDPLICDEDGTVRDTAWANSRVNYSFAFALGARAMLRAHDGKIDDAWQDLLACHRLARLTGQSPFGSCQARTALLTEIRAANGDLALLRQVKLTAAQIAAMRNDLDHLSPMPRFVDAIDVGDRCRALAGIFCLARRGVNKMETVTGQKGMANLSSNTGADWNIVLRIVNSWFDRAAAVLREPSFAERVKAHSQFDSDLRDEIDASKSWKTVLSALTNPREVRSKVAGVLFASICVTTMESRTEGEAEMQFKLTQLAFALAAYRADHNSYPAKLADLVPKYVKQVPKDVFNSDADLHYTLQGEGYLLYSVGSNGKDDGGKGYDDRKNNEDWDDLAVRMSAAKP